MVKYILFGFASKAALRLPAATNTSDYMGNRIKKITATAFTVTVIFLKSGNVLSSQALDHQVLSALVSLTSVFGMGTGGTLLPLSPEWYYNSFRRYK